jgi:maltose/moltooligosaccharide transporter
MEPFRALVGDMLPPAQRTTGFALQSLFIGTGAVVASSLPWIFTNWFDIPNADLQKGVIPDSVKYSFYIGAFMLFVTVMWTVFSTREYPPALGDEEKLKSREKRKIENENITQSRLRRYGLPLLLAGLVFSLIVFFAGAEKELYMLGFVFCLFGIVFLLAAQYITQGRSYLGFVHIAKDFITMPKTMVQLAYVQFFSWFALFSMWIYSTPAVTSYIFKSSDATTLAYNEGANLVGILFAAYNGIAALAALFLPLLARRTSRRVTHWIALTCGGLGLISFYFISDPFWLWFSMVGVGIAWASILSVPYAMLSGSLPPEKMGYYMGIFNFFIVIPQIIAGTVLGFLLRHLFQGQAIYILVTGGISLIIAGLLCLRVRDNEEVIIQHGRSEF